MITVKRLRKHGSYRIISLDVFNFTSSVVQFCRLDLQLAVQKIISVQSTSVPIYLFFFKFSKCFLHLVFVVG